MYEAMAVYDTVVRRELDNPIFTNKEEITSIIRSLVLKNILEEKDGMLKDEEIKILTRFGDIQSADRRVLSFTRQELNEKLILARLKLYEEIFYPKLP